MMKKPERSKKNCKTTKSQAI